MEKNKSKEKSKKLCKESADKIMLEKCLPKYLENDIENLKKGVKEKVLHVDCLINEVQGSINSAWVDGFITEEQCDYLYSKYVYGKLEDII